MKMLVGVRAPIGLQVTKSSSLALSSESNPKMAQTLVGMMPAVWLTFCKAH